MGGISNLDLFAPYKKHLTYKCVGVTTTVGTYIPQERGAGAAHTQCAIVSLPGECQLLTSGGVGGDSDDEDDVLRGAEAECYSRVSVSFWGPFCLALCPQLLTGMPVVVAVMVVVTFCVMVKTGPFSLFSFSEISPSPS